MIHYLNGGFLLIVAKYQLTEPEVFLKSILKQSKYLNNNDLGDRIKQFIEICTTIGTSTHRREIGFNFNKSSSLQKNTKQKRNPKK